MAKSHQDKVEDEVRRRMTSLASAAGIDRGRIEVEVLYLLPTEFVRMYSQLFYEALDDPNGGHGGGKDEGRLKAAGKPRDALKARSMGGAKVGKKFVAGAWPIRSEKALDEKRKLDKKLVTEVNRSLGAARSNGESVLDRNPGAKRCDECGRFQEYNWSRCPFHPQGTI